MMKVYEGYVEDNEEDDEGVWWTSISNRYLLKDGLKGWDQKINEIYGELPIMLVHLIHLELKLTRMD